MCFCSLPVFCVCACVLVVLVTRVSRISFVWLRALVCFCSLPDSCFFLVSFVRFVVSHACLCAFAVCPFFGCVCLCVGVLVLRFLVTRVSRISFVWLRALVCFCSLPDSCFFLVSFVLMFYSKLVDWLEKYRLVYVLSAVFGLFFCIVALLTVHPSIGLANTVTAPHRFFG